jgi:hypothetical protein
LVIKTTRSSALTAILVLRPRTAARPQVQSEVPRILANYRRPEAKRKPENASVGNLVIAGFAAGLAIIKPVLAEPYLEHGLAEATILLTGTTIFGHLTLHAAIFVRGRRGHAKA